MLAENYWKSTASFKSGRASVQEDISKEELERIKTALQSPTEAIRESAVQELAIWHHFFGKLLTVRADGHRMWDGWSESWYKEGKKMYIIIVAMVLFYVVGINGGDFDYNPHVICQKHMWTNANYATDMCVKFCQHWYKVSGFCWKDGGYYLCKCLK
ncbi:unnamed protein product [Cylicocyclus nassatus]|uniref:Uncharacterized protein n=1 Tax=Cylicocyclus nassatus TaxID=53992 RepID=A0AA36MAZ1_CYLNA|nr:unnamed protein product [Cylicocyclus nassatus]